MSRVAMIDGTVMPLDQARVSVLDRGFLYGDSVFETMRTYDGRPFALEEHLERLERSAGLVFIEPSVPRHTLAEEVHAAVSAAGNPESYVRVILTRGEGELGLDPSLSGPSLRVIIVTELHTPPATAYEEGIAAITFALRRVGDATPAAGAKIGNYLTSVLAVRAARPVGASEALVVDAHDRVVEGATSNVFFVKGARLVTPPLDVGILPGVTRAIVMSIAGELGVPVELAAPRSSELWGFDEVFISSSIREMLAVVRIDGRAVGSGKPGPVYRRLHAAFRRRVRGDRGAS